jgi:GNAT superfamily N-acetyltransferase
MSDEMSFGLSDIVFRRFTENDLSPLALLLEKTPEIAQSGDDISVAAIRAQLTWPGHVPERDRWVVVLRTDPDRLIGYSSVFKASSTPRADIVVATHPNVRRRGIGSELLLRALADADALGAQDASCYVSERDTGTPDFLSQRGFAPVSMYVELLARPDQHFSELEWPEGFSIRGWRDETDVATLVEASNRCYEGLWGHNASTAEEWAHWLPALDKTGISFLVGPDGALAGMVRAELREGVGVIDAPGVVVAWRGAGLYRPLLLHAITWFAARNPSAYRVESWGDDPSTIDEYQSLGFALSRRDALFRRRLSASASSAAVE